MAEMRHGARGNYKHCKAGPGGKPCDPCRLTENERVREWWRRRHGLTPEADQRATIRPTTP